MSKNIVGIKITLVGHEDPFFFCFSSYRELVHFLRLHERSKAKKRRPAAIEKIFEIYAI